MDNKLTSSYFAGSIALEEWRADMQVMMNQELAMMDQELATQCDAFERSIAAAKTERERWTFAGKQVVIEVVGGKYDGQIFDSRSNDPMEEKLVEFLRHSEEFERIAVIDDHKSAWVQLRAKSG